MSKTAENISPEPIEENYRASSRVGIKKYPSQESLSRVSSKGDDSIIDNGYIF